MAGFEFVKDSQGDLIGLNAQHERERLSEIYFPQMAVQGPWKTEIGLVNYSASPVILTITAYKADGSLYGSDNLKNNPVNYSLDKGASMREDVAALFGFKGQNTLDGWIRVQATSPSVNGYIRYGLPVAGSVALVAAPAAGVTRALFSHIATIGDFFTGLALLNPGSVVANVRVMAFTPGGKALGIFDTVVAPGHRISKLINELIPKAAGQGGGFIWVKSDVPVFATSLFGSGKILANIPPQAVANQFVPEGGSAAGLTISPPAALLQPASGQTFQLSGASGSVIWKVNGIAGGDDIVGRIKSGVYTAPPNPPDPQSVTISAENSGRSVGASVDLVRKEELFSGLGLVQAVAYLSSLKRLYEAELSGISTGDESGSEIEPAAARSSIYYLPPTGQRQTVITIENEEIADMVPFTASGGKEYMLLAARKSGRILRLDPDQPQNPYEVARGLSLPSSMVVDRVSGNLLVAEADRISTVPRQSLEAGLRSQSQALKKHFPMPGPVRASSLVQASASSLAVDECTGNVYFTDLEAGTVNVYSKATGQISVAAENFTAPTDILAIYREGISCPAALNLLVVERNALDPDEGWVTLVLPYSGQQYIWFEVPAAFDVTFLPEDNPYTEVAGILFGQIVNQEVDLFFADLPDDYNLHPTNGLTDSLCVGSVFLGDPDFESVIREGLGLGPGGVIGCDRAQGLASIDAPTREILFLDGIEFFPLLQDVRLEDNYIFDLEPLKPLSLVHTLDLSDNLLFDVDALSDLDLLWRLDVSNNLISDVSPLITLWDLDYLDLSDNLIDDIDSLVFNFGLGDGDFVDLSDNLLDFGDCRGIRQLEIQGVEVNVDAVLDCEGTLAPGDLGVFISAEPQTVPYGGYLTYTTVLRNWNNDLPATDVLFVNLLPFEGTFIDFNVEGLGGECETFEDVLLVCYFPEIRAGYYFQFPFQIQVFGLPGDIIQNYAWVSSEEYDVDISDNRNVLNTQISP